MDMNDCIFCEIVKGEIPKDFRFKDENIVAFDDIHPVAKVHVLFIPKEHVAAFEDLMDDDILSSVRHGIQKIVRQEGLVGKGYKIIVNGGGGQVINHLHFHLIGPTGVHVPVE
jgi:histidine triad (HIT) family protein